MEAQAFTCASSPFLPVAIGFFGLGTGTTFGVGRPCWLFPRAVRKSTEPLAFGVSGCRDSCGPSSHLSTDRTAVVQRLQQCGSPIYGRHRVPGLRSSLVRDGRSAVYRFEHPAGWLDGDRIAVTRRPWR